MILDQDEGRPEAGENNTARLTVDQQHAAITKSLGLMASKMRKKRKSQYLFLVHFIGYVPIVNMGMFKKHIRLANMQTSDLFFEDDFWVDTGALYSFVPEDLLFKIKVEPVGTRDLILADGRVDKRLLGFCNFEISGLPGSIPCPVIFAPKESLLLLGATALENFGVAADPINKDLKPILSVIGGFLGSEEI